MLQKIYHDLSNPGSLQSVTRLLRRTRDLNVKGANRQTMKKFLKGVQGYTLHKTSTRSFFTKSYLCCWNRRSMAGRFG